jgi:carboxynorspermidine decarboxylase
MEFNPPAGAVSTDPLPFDPAAVDTPALVIDEAAILDAAERFAALAHGVGCQALYSLKALVIPGILERLRSPLDGFSASSEFEARLAREILGTRGLLQFVSPGLSGRNAGVIADLCDQVSFNSLPQWRRLGQVIGRSAACGLRLNPGVSFVGESRYDPCRPGSKLGIPLDQFPRSGLQGLGLHLHNNCESTRIGDLFDTLVHVQEARPDLLADASWINLGGGYLFNEAEDAERLDEAVALLGAAGRPVFLEPGAGLVQSAGFLVTSVTDCFPSSEQRVAVLDTTVNHLPEVLEYQYQPEIAGVEPGALKQTLAGASCLAGDQFGAYGLAAPLAPGDRLVLLDAGSYSFVKSHMFNGINLPTLYALTPGGHIEERRRFGYSDFLQRCGGQPDAR